MSTLRKLRRNLGNLEDKFSEIEKPKTKSYTTENQQKIRPTHYMNPREKTRQYKVYNLGKYYKYQKRDKRQFRA